LPALDLVLAHIVDQAALLGFAQFDERPPVVERLACAVDRTQCGAIEIRIRRTHVEDARLEQRLLRRNRDLLIDEMGYPGLARPRDERLADRIEGCGLRGCQCPQRNALRARRTRREQYFGAAHREGERAGCRALHKGASFHVVHDLLPSAPIARSPSPAGLASDWRGSRSSQMDTKFNADFTTESSSAA